MASEEDNFDIDIYGDGGEADYQQEEPDEPKEENHTESKDAPQESYDGAIDQLPNSEHTQSEVKLEDQEDPKDDGAAQKINSTDDSSHAQVNLPKQAPQTQGLKRKEGADDRPLDPGATSALFLSDLHWWITDDDVRGWANQSQCEDELTEVTFGEHKINGKSKGQAYVLFQTAQAATAAKHKIESFGEGQQYARRFTVAFTNPYTNPFRTLHKDGTSRSTNTQNSRNNSGAYSNTGPPQQNMGYNNAGSNYRGNRGGYHNRGNAPNTMSSGYGGRGGYQQTPPMNTYQTPAMGFQPQMSQMNGMPSYGNFGGRGGYNSGGAMRGGGMGMRGGRGGMMNVGMAGMNMGGMPGMGNMGMGMPGMGGPMGMQGTPGFGGPTQHYNASFFPQAQASANDSSWGSHAAKRQRQE